MNKKIYCFFFSLLFVACTNNVEEVVVSEMNESKNPDVKIVLLSEGIVTKSGEVTEKTILQFKDLETFNKTVKELSSGTKEAALAWEKELGFISLNTIFDNAMEEAATLGQSEADYKNFKAKYSESLYFPEYKDDYGAYLPVSNESLAFVLNCDGEVMIGEEIMNFVDITTYEQLQQIGQAMYDLGTDTPMLMAAGVGDYLGDQYDSGWQIEDDRKLRLKIGRRIRERQGEGPFVIALHYEISFRKKVWIGWVNYSSKTGTKTTITVANKNTYTREQIEEGHSSHDHYFLTSRECPDLYVNLGHGEFATTRVNGSATISYQGFSTPRTFNFDMLGGSHFN